MTTLKDIAAILDEAKGREILDRIANPDPHEGQLPIRHHISGRIVAWIPERFAGECRPVIRKGLVVGYMRVTLTGEWLSPHFQHNGELLCWMTSWTGVELWPIFELDGTFSGLLSRE